MVQLLLIVAIAAVHLGDAAGVHLVRWSAGTVWLAAWLPPLILWLGFHLLARRCGRRMDELGDGGALRLADTAMSRLRITGVCWHVFCIFGLGWAGAVRGLTGNLILIDEALMLAPVLGLFSALWWSFYPLDLRAREAVLRRQLQAGAVYPPLSRVQYVASCIRHQALLVLVPILLFTLWGESADAIAAHITTPLRWEQVGPWVRSAGLAVVLVLSPAILRIAWNTVRIGPGEVDAQSRAMMRRYGVRVRGPYLWRTHGAMVNGAILGIIYPLRYLLLTDALLDQIDSRHLDGVLAHEVAHVKKRHLYWLAAAPIAAILLAGWASALIGYFAHIRPESLWLELGASVGALVAAGLALGYVSRRFEWQADAFAARHLSETAGSETITPDAAYTMSGALQSVADLNGIPIARFMWRHGSIATRQYRLSDLIGLPVDALPIDAQVRRIKFIIALALLAGIVPFLWQLLT